MIGRLRSIRADDRMAIRRSMEADLKAIGWDPDHHQSTRLARTVEALVGELAALAELANANKSTPTNTEGRYRDVHPPIPSFTPAVAAEKLEKAEQRLWREYERLASDVRRPTKAPKSKCTTCRRRASLVDEFCGPCGAAILQTHRRQKSIEEGSGNDKTTTTEED